MAPKPQNRVEIFDIAYTMVCLSIGSALTRLQLGEAFWEVAARFVIVTTGSVALVWVCRIAYAFLSQFRIVRTSEGAP